MNDPTPWSYMSSTHAEVDLLRKLTRSHKYLTKKRLDLIVVRYNKLGVLVESKPCKHCMDILNRSRFQFRYVYYSTSEGVIVKKLFSELLSQNLFITRGERSWYRKK